jgi:hypothetical protein
MAGMRYHRRVDRAGLDRAVVVVEDTPVVE